LARNPKETRVCIPQNDLMGSARRAEAGQEEALVKAITKAIVPA
jgi:hypothetical protein